MLSSRPRRALLALGLALELAPGVACAGTQELVVTATAYNSVPSQTTGNPHVGAWGDRLRPGMRAIAVSRDLLDEGLTRGVEVEIEGLAGTWEVRDKLARRWKRRIDIYMGSDVEAAREWGRREVRIRWSAED